MIVLRNCKHMNFIKERGNFMGNRNPYEFNRVEYLRSFIAKALQSKSKAVREIRGYLRLLNQGPNFSENNEKKKILERIDGLFSTPQFMALIKKEKEQRRNNKF